MKKYLLIALAALTLAGCEKNPDVESSTPKERNLTGFAQKGQFVKGSQVTAFAVGSDLVATGESFPASISDDLGAFGIAGKTAAPFFELRAEGYYFNELEGATSGSPLYLEAFVKSDDSKANINLMTTAIRPRVKKLIKEGKSYAEAINQAQNELLKAIGFTGSAGNFDDMDITGTTDADGMLLAFACMVQKDRDASQVTTLIQEIASALETNGELNATLTDKVISKAQTINPFTVIDNLANYYKEKSLTVNSVPAFWRYLDSSYDAPFLIVDHETFPFLPDPGNVVSSTIKSPDAISGVINVLASINFTVEVDVEGASATKEQIFGPTYRISYQIPAHEGDSDRISHVIFKDDSGTVLAQREFTQGADLQYIMISSVQTKASYGSGGEIFTEGVEIGVNGKAYKLQRFEQFYGAIGVAVPKVESYAISYPVGAVVSGGHVARAKTTVNADQSTLQDIPYYAALASYGGMELPQVVNVNLKPCLDLFRFKSNVTIKRIEVCPVDENEYMAGTASFVLNQQDIAYFPELNPNIEFESGATHSIAIGSANDGEYFSCVTFPQKYKSGLQIKIRIEVEGATSDYTLTVADMPTLNAGYLVTFMIKLEGGTLRLDNSIADLGSSSGGVVIN